MKRRSLYVLVVILLLAAAVRVTGLPQGLPRFPLPQLPQSPPSGSVRSPAGGGNQAYVLNEKEQRVMKEVGSVPYITDVLFDETKDGKLILAATAEIGPDSEPDKKRLAREIAYRYTLAVYKAGVPVAEASIHITDDNHLVLGTSLGVDHYKKMSEGVLAGNGSGVAGFFQFLKQNETQSDRPETNTWMYELP